MYKIHYEDDQDIHNDIDLWRRVDPLYFVEDHNLGGIRPSSQAFQDSSDGTPMSIDISTIAKDASRTIQNYEGYAVAAITAGLARDCGQGIAPDPRPDNPAHGYVFGKKTGGVRKKLAKNARWVIRPA